MEQSPGVDASDLPATSDLEEHIVPLAPSLRPNVHRDRSAVVRRGDEPVVDVSVRPVREVKRVEVKEQSAHRIVFLYAKLPELIQLDQHIVKVRSDGGHRQVVGLVEEQACSPDT